MAQSVEPAGTEVTVLFIEEFRRDSVKATVKYQDCKGIAMEWSETYSLDEFRHLHGAEAALKAFQGKDDETDEEDGASYSCLESLLSCIVSCFTSIIPSERPSRVDSVLQCKPSTPDTQPPIYRHGDVETPRKTQRTVSSDSGQTLVTNPYTNFIMSRCFVFSVAITANGAHTKILGELTSKDGIRILRLRELEWKALENYWGSQLKGHVSEEVYEMARSESQTDEAAKLFTFTAQFTLHDFGLSSDQINTLVEGGSVWLFKDACIKNIPWISKPL